MNKGGVPTILVVFGATGDLSQRKLIPALLDLSVKGYMPKTFRIVGFSRQAFDTKGFQEFVRASIENKKHGHSSQNIDDHIKNYTYCVGDFEDPNSYESLAERLVEIDEQLGMCSNKLFYLAVRPEFYDIIFQNLADSGLTIPCSEELGWTRVLVEKPFGRDAEGAQKLDEKLGLLFKEEQIFRIDHYLAKETLQNILMFRFSNALFEPLWDHKNIKKVEIKLFETLGIEGRGAFYDSIGALRDVGQNHILQMLSFIAMEKPASSLPVDIRRERAVVLKKLVPFRADDIQKKIQRGQFHGYRDEKNVSSESKTETYFHMEVEIGNLRWKGVPFVLESGKQMSQTKTEINIFFKDEFQCLCPPDQHQPHPNVLTFRIQPNEGISILFWAKTPGFEFCLEPKTLSFSYGNSEDMKRLPDAYERVLYDCIRGDQTLFTSTDEMNATWKFITPILEQWHSLPLIEYDKGSESGEIK